MIDLVGTASAWAPVNIALVKYWGKRNDEWALPAVGSLSLTLADLGTTTRVTFFDEPGPDAFILNGEAQTGATAARVTTFLNRVRRRAGLVDARATVDSVNDLPTEAGLATSASGFAALTLAAFAAAGMLPDAMDAAEVAWWARLGSGSAPRSLLGGFVELPPPRADDPQGRDMAPVALLAPEVWDVRMILAITEPSPKAMGSGAGMRHTRDTSPYYAAWVAHHDADLSAARHAVLARDLPVLGRVVERSAWRMHACAMAADPPLVYLAPASLAALRAVGALREAGVPAYATMDAGPQVKVLTLAHGAAEVARTLAEVSGVSQVIVARPGPGARLLDGPHHEETDVQPPVPTGVPPGQASRTPDSPPRAVQEDGRAAGPSPRGERS